jgi:hypothetical protein
MAPTPNPTDDEKTRPRPRADHSRTSAELGEGNAVAADANTHAAAGVPASPAPTQIADAQIQEWEAQLAAIKAKRAAIDGKIAGEKKALAQLKTEHSTSQTPPALTPSQDDFSNVLPRNITPMQGAEIGGAFVAVNGAVVGGYKTLQALAPNATRVAFKAANIGVGPGIFIWDTAVDHEKLGDATQDSIEGSLSTRALGYYGGHAVRLGSAAGKVVTPGASAVGKVVRTTLSPIGRATQPLASRAGETLGRTIVEPMKSGAARVGTAIANKTAESGAGRFVMKAGARYVAARTAASGVLAETGLGETLAAVSATAGAAADFAVGPAAWCLTLSGDSGPRPTDGPFLLDRIQMRLKAQNMDLRKGLKDGTFLPKLSSTERAKLIGVVDAHNSYNAEIQDYFTKPQPWWRVNGPEDHSMHLYYQLSDETREALINEDKAEQNAPHLGAPSKKQPQSRESQASKNKLQNHRVGP